MSNEGVNTTESGCSSLVHWIYRVHSPFGSCCGAGRVICISHWLRSPQITVPSIQCWYLITRPYIAMSIYQEIGKYLNSIFPRLSEIPISIVCIVLELRLNKQKIIQTIDELSLQMLHILGFDPMVFRESLRFVINIPRLFFLILSYPIQQNICEI